MAARGYFVVLGMCSSFISCGVSNPPASNNSTPPPKAEPVTVYAATEDLICATSPKFLDSSALVAPARFARVAKGTQVVIVDVGGAFTGNLYWGLSAGGRTTIYIYRDAFEQKFEPVRDMMEDAPTGTPSKGRSTPISETESAPVKTDPSETFREFKSTNGSFTVRARFITMDRTENVSLRREDTGKIITVQLDQLSEQDQEWIAEKIKGLAK